ncbi:MAG: tyrosine-type recombinase/integrase, partial [Sulfitobacter sp.]|nr:tyrosine-type recombinase/integrase [Sulfitobacter sp.]
MSSAATSNGTTSDLLLEGVGELGAATQVDPDQTTTAEFRIEQTGDGPGVDLRVLPGGVRVDYVAETADEGLGLVQVLTVPDGWVAEELAGVIVWRDAEGAEVGVWSGGQAWDASVNADGFPAETSVSVELLSFDAGVARASVVVDEAWMRDPARVFPIVVDPALSRLTQMARNYIRASGVGKEGACHLFRHTMATLMLEGGADIRHIQAMLGHVRLET